MPPFHRQRPVQRHYPIIYIPTNTTNRLLESDNRTSQLNDAYNIDLNYHYTDSSGHDLTANADYGLYRIRSNQLQPNNYYDSTGKIFCTAMITISCPRPIFTFTA
jgi:iron complex outermembrane receptor protein